MENNQNLVFIDREICSLCNSKNLSKEMEMEDFERNLGTFSLVKCNKCGMCYTSPYPTTETIPLLYSVRDGNNFDSDNSWFFEYLKNTIAKHEMKKYLKNLPSTNNSETTVVDFGTGNGRYACAIQKAASNISVTAVDFIEEIPKFIQHNKSGKIEYIITPDFFNNAKKYDVIFLRQVLEHTENPLEFVKKLSEKLTPQGRLIIEVPNTNSVVNRLFGKYSPLYFPPYHLFHFTTHNLSNTLDQTALPYEITRLEVPLLSHILANSRREKLNNIHRFMGMLLYPIQLILGLITKEKAVLVAVVKNIQN